MRAFEDIFSALQLTSLDMKRVAMCRLSHEPPLRPDERISAHRPATMDRLRQQLEEWNLLAPVVAALQLEKALGTRHKRSLANM